MGYVIQIKERAMDQEVLLLTITGACARCGEPHEPIEFGRLQRSIIERTRDGDRVVATHWAPCPVNGEPILAVVIKEPI